MGSVHSARLERWLGAHTVEGLSAAMKTWPGPPIAIGNIPGAVWACGGGDFAGRIKAGQMSPLVDYVEQRLKRVIRNASRRQLYAVHAGFSSVGDIVSEMTTGGKGRTFLFNKAGPIGSAVGAATSLWGLGNVPVAGADAAAAPGGAAPTDATAGAFPFTNPTGGDTQHLVGADFFASVVPNQLLLYDRIFQVKKTMNSNALESVTGIPTRYQSSTAGTADYAGGNFAFPEVGATVLAAGAHNWTVCKYRNQAGTDAVSFPSTPGISGAAVRNIDLELPQWFMPYASGDSGVKDLDQMQYDTSLIATGIINWVIGHPIAFMGPLPVANQLMHLDGIMTSFNLTRIFDDAALAFLEVGKGATTATNYNGSILTVAG